MPIRYSQFVKRPNEEHDFTSEQILELQNCYDDIFYFMENYVKVVDPDEGVIPFEPYSYQRELIEKFRNHRFNIALCSRQSGKANSVDTPIPMPAGQWTTMGDLKVGDTILDETGSSTKITFATDVMYNHDCYEIEFDNGEKIVADKDHLWKVYSNCFTKRVDKSRISKIVSTEKAISLLKDSNSKKQGLYIDYIKPIKNNKVNLDIDPYVFGLWVGSGDSKKSSKIHINKDDSFELTRYIERKGYSTSSFKPDKREKTGYFTVYGLITYLKKIGINGKKYIPRKYLEGSIYQRIQLLRGILDSDGSCNKKGSCEFYQKDYDIILSMKELLSSLGVKSRIRDKIINGELYYTISFTTKKFYVFNLRRKRERQKKCLDHPKNYRIYFKSIRKVDSVPVRCIQVDSPNHLFLCGRTMIPTHNTTSVCVFALWYAIFNSNKTIGIVANKESRAKMALARIKDMYKEIPYWLKPGAEEFAQTFVTFDNGSRILISATSKDAFRGEAANIIICDEFAFVPKEIADEFWAANYPTISKSKEAKVIIISCVAGDTYVYTEKGPKQVKDFIIEVKPGAYQVSEYSILGKNQINCGNLVINSGIADTKIIKTTNSSLEGSLSHKLWACKDGKYGWYKTSELEKGDYISIQYGMNVWGNDNTINFKSKKRRNKQGASLEIKEITNDWAYLFGLYLAEGYADKYRLNIACGDDISYAFDRLDLKYSCNDGMHYVINCLSLIELLKHVGFDITKKAKEKDIPKRLLGMSSDNIAAMLRGIFDGDGFSRKDKGLVGIGLSSKKLIDQIKVLLMNFGILTNYFEVTSKPTKKVKVSSTQFRLQADKSSSRKFYELIGFELRRKQKNREILNEYKESRTDIIPFAKKILISTESNTSSKYGVIRDFERLIGKDIYNRDPNGHFSRALMLRMKSVLEDIDSKEIKDFFDKNVSDKIKWCKIRDIENSRGKVYDFSLPDKENDPWCHSVIYNGFVGHQTPNGLFNLFHQIWVQAEAEQNSFVTTKVGWRDVPGRDAAWAAEQLANIGPVRFRQEFAVEFLGSTNTVIDATVLEILLSSWKEPELIDLNGRLSIYEKPQQDDSYVIGVDVAKGTGEHYSVATVLKIVSLRPIRMKQVSVFRDNHTDVYEFSDIINKMSIYYNKAHIMVENNAEGAAVVNRLWWDLGGNLVNTGNKRKNLGIRATPKTKPKAVMLMKRLVEDGSLKLVDKSTIEELASFIERGKKFFGKDKTDDAVSALYWGCYFLEMNVTYEKFELSKENKLHENYEVDESEKSEGNVWGILSDIEDIVDDWSWLND